ncbi:MAG: ABC transporter permease [Clostridia bacterium]|nr:ABC transporter permease [Clostridia bacterium]MBQ9704245.1 ABC transporter permease [Clostridia bacterium]
MAFINALPYAVAQGLIWGIMAIGVFITYKVLDIADLTVDGSLATGGAVFIVLNAAGVPTILGLLIAFLAGCLAGFITGIMHTAFGIQPILAGILTQLMLWSINFKIMGRSNQPLSNETFVTMNIERLGFTITWMLLICVGIVALLYFFFGTELGCAIRATGNNESMSKAQGINVSFNKVLGLMLSNGLVALSGAFLAQYNGAADIKMGAGAIVIGLAAIVIGTTVISKLTSNFALTLTGTVIGAIVYFSIYQFVVNLNVDSNLLKMLSAVVVFIFLAAPYVKKNYFHNIKFKKKVAEVASSVEGGKDNA